MFENRIWGHEHNNVAFNNDNNNFDFNEIRIFDTCLYISKFLDKF